MSYVPGVTVSGPYVFRDERSASVTVGGPLAARGKLTLDAAGNVSGTLDGRAVSFSPPANSATANRPADWPEPFFPHPALRAR